MAEQHGQTRYRVVWEIDLDADSPAAAALAARRIQLDPEAWVGVFRVTDERGTELSVDVDGPARLAAGVAQEGDSDG